MTREFPLLEKMGPYDLDASTRLLDDKWQYQRMGMYVNSQRRIPILYELAKAPPQLSDAYVQALIEILNAPFRSDLDPLDRDDEFRYWRGYSPDFHPRLQKFCTFDEETVDRHVERLVDSIRGKEERDEDGNLRRRTSSLAERMTRSFINLYKGVIEDLKQTPGNEAQISQLQAKVDVLEQFLQTLQQ